MNKATRRYIELSMITTELLVVVTTQQYVYSLNPTGKSKPTCLNLNACAQGANHQSITRTQMCNPPLTFP